MQNLSNVQLSPKAIGLIAGGLLILAALFFLPGNGGLDLGGGDVSPTDSLAVETPIVIPDGRYQLVGSVYSRPANNTFVIAVTSATAMGLDESWSFMSAQTGRGTAADFIGRLVVVYSPNHQILDNMKIGLFYNAKGELICQTATVVGEWDNTHSRFNLINASESEKVGKPLSVVTFDPCQSFSPNQYQSLTP